MNAPIPDDKLDAIKKLIFQGQKIEAIKMHRQNTKTGLMEAKQDIEEIEKELRVTAPEEFTRSTDRRGCLGMFVALSGLGLLVMLWIIWKS